MHPSRAEGFEWDDGNEEELARHHVKAMEVEQVFANDPRWARNKKSGSGDWRMVGRADGGRILTIIVLWKEEERTIRAVTGWDATDGDRNRFLGR